MSVSLVVLEVKTEKQRVHKLLYVSSIHILYHSGGSKNIVSLAHLDVAVASFILNIFVSDDELARKVYCLALVLLEEGAVKQPGEAVHLYNVLDVVLVSEAVLSNLHLSVLHPL